MTESGYTALTNQVADSDCSLVGRPMVLHVQVKVRKSCFSGLGITSLKTQTFSLYDFNDYDVDLAHLQIPTYNQLEQSVIGLAITL